MKDARAGIGFEKDFLLREKYKGIRTPAYEADALRLDAGEPLAYVIGWVPFLGAKIFLDSHPLIPRPETEYWVEIAIHAMQNRKPLADMIYHIRKEGRDSIRCLDLFAGSGCIGVAILKQMPSTLVDFGELVEDHFSTILKNIRENGIDEARVRILQTDVWSGIATSYDFILANPPYLSQTRMERVEQSVREYEPKEALFAKEEGFALIRKMILGAATHLNPGGALYIEHEPEHAKTLKELAGELGFMAENEKDQYGVIRYSVLKKSA